MSGDSAWVTFWEAVLAIGLGGFFMVVLVVIPLGARDIKRLFAKLDAPAEEERVDRDDG